MTKEANNRANADFRVLDMKDALTVAFRSAKQLMIAKGVDPDLTTIKLDVTSQLLIRMKL
jgi:hypothetical protein